MKPTFIVLSMVLLLFSACGAGGGGGAGGIDSTSSISIASPSFSCELSSRSDLGDKGLSCNDDTDISYQESENVLCRVDNINGVAVSTCMESGETLPVQTCMRSGSSVACSDVDFSCEVSSRSTSDNRILSCDDDTAMSIDISNSELCRIDLTNGAGFCLDDENALGRLSVVWTGYASNVVGIGESIALNTPLWGPNGTVFRYSATPASVCSVDGESGSLSIAGFGDCNVALTASIGRNNKVIEKTVYGRLSQGTSWSGYTENSIDFGTTPPTLIAPQYAPNRVSYRYSGENTDVCTVDSNTGEITALTEAGNCVITMTSSATNFADRSISFTLRVNPLTLPSLTWTNPYGSGPFDISTTVSAPSAGSVTGQGSLSVALENYRSTTPTICSVDETTGVSTFLLTGDCTIETTASLPGYTSQTLSTTLTVSLARMSLSWTSPIPSLGRKDSIQPDSPSGIPGAAAVSVAYSSRTKDKCSVNSTTGEITGIANGDCTARLTVTFPGYREGSVDIDIEIKNPQDTLLWTGYTASDVDFGSDAPELNAPTGKPSRASFMYSSLTEDVCTVDERSGALTLVGVGDCRIRLISSHDDYGDKLFEHTVRVNPLTFSTLEWDTLYGNGPFDVEGTGYAPDSDNLLNVPEGVDVTLSDFASETPGICQVDETGSLTFLRDGSCSLRVTASATGYGDPVVSVSVEAAPINMNLSWDGYNDSDDRITLGEAAPALESPSLTTVTAHTFSYASSDGTVCSVDRYGNLTILRDGVCEITLTASAPGYNDATETSIQTINLKRIAGMSWRGYSPNTVGIGQTREATNPTGVPEGASVAYSTESEECTVDGTSGTVTGQSEGTCRVTLTVSKFGHEDYTRTNSVRVRKAQSIGWPGYSANTMVFGTEAPTSQPPTDDNGARVVYTSLTRDVCSVRRTSGELTILDQGLCRIRLSATKSGHAVRVFDFDLRISPIAMRDFAWTGYDPNAVVFPNIPDLVEPTGQVDGTTLSYTSQTEDICTVNETTGRLTILDAGVCTVTITAEAPGHRSVNTSSSITITQAPMSFSWRGYSASNASFGGRPPTLRTPRGAPPGTSFRYSSAPLTVCVVDPESGALTLSGSGDCTITAIGSLLGHTDSRETFALRVALRPISNLTWAGYSETSIDFGETAPSLIVPKGVPRGTTFLYASSTPNICTVDSTTGALEILDAGGCTINSTASATSYRTATADFTLTINRIDMDSLVWTGYASTIIGVGGPPPVKNPPTGYPPGASFHYSSTPTDICTVDRLTGALSIGGRSSGVCSINLTANAPGYNEKVITANVVVGVHVIWGGYDNAFVTFPDAPNLNAPVVIVPSDSTVRYTTVSEDICRVDPVSGAVTSLNPGLCVVKLTASKPGYISYVTNFHITIEPRYMRNLTWDSRSPSTALRRGPFVYLNSFTGEPSGVSYRYSTTTQDHCVIGSDGELWGLEVGTCQVTVTAQATGYRDKTLTRDMAITREKVITSEASTCALLSDGQIKCWGEGVAGTLGGESLNNIGDGSNEMGVHLASVNLGTGLKAKSLAGASSGHYFHSKGHICALLENGKVKCWGHNDKGQLGHGHSNNRGGASEHMGDRLPYTDLGTTSKALSVGGRSSCAILDNDKVKCWGGNASGQLGLGDTNNRGDGANEMGNSLPYVNLGTRRTAKDIAVGSEHVCTLLDDNRVKCWGANSSGQLGLGDTDNRGDGSGEMEVLPLVDLGTNRTAKRVSVGQYHSCAILDNNDLVCWGGNPGYVLGISSDALLKIGDVPNEMGNNLSPTHLVSQDAIHLSLGNLSTCVIRKNGVVYCWGASLYGRLGGGQSDESKGDPTTQPADVDVDLGSTRKAKTLQSGQDHACALLDNDDIKCWGRNHYGQLGQGHTRNLGDEMGELGDNLVAVDLVPDMIDLVWTGYASDTIADGESAPALTPPTGAPAGTTFEYSTTTTTVCSVDSVSGAVTLVGGGLCEVRLTASRSGYRNYVKAFHIRFSPIDMSNLAWGNGVPTSALRRGPFVYLNSFVGEPSGVSYRYSTTTQNHCVIGSDGELWGLEVGTCQVTVTAQAAGYHDKTLTRDITIIRDKVVTSEASTCALLSDGQVKCWGEGVAGTLGSESTNNLGDGPDEMGTHLASVNLGTGLKAKDLAGASSGHYFYLKGHVCALLENGKVKCWGHNDNGQLGHGHSNDWGGASEHMGDRLPYTDLGTTSKALSMGGRSSCAILDNDKVKCWGNNSLGQLGLGDTNNRGDGANEMGNSLPYVNLGTQRTAKDIAVGSEHVCTLLDNNKVKCWGANSSGQLGLGDTDHRGDGSGEMESLPFVDLGTNRTAKRVSVGQHHSCAILDNNDLACWGGNPGYVLGISSDALLKIGDGSNEMGDNLSPTHLVSQDAIHVSVGNLSTCVIRKNGVAYCWGASRYGRLGGGQVDESKGDPATGSADIDVDLGSTRKAKTLQSGQDHACALLDNDDIKCWGRNHKGQLGQGHTRNLGDEVGEMGDSLAAVVLVPDMIDLVWRGYSSDTVGTNDGVPSLHLPTQVPIGATLTYSTMTPNVCTIESRTGTLGIIGNGTCRVQLTARATGYRDGIRMFHITVSGR